MGCCFDNTKGNINNNILTVTAKSTIIGFLITADGKNYHHLMFDG